MENERKHCRKMPKCDCLLRPFLNGLERHGIGVKGPSTQTDIQHQFVFVQEGATHDFSFALFAIVSNSGCHPISGFFWASKSAKAWKLPHVIALGIGCPSRVLSSDNVSVRRTCPWITGDANVC